MDLAIHVGPLTAFFAPAVRADAASAGEAPPSDETIRARIEDWRDWIGAGLVGDGHLSAPPAWDEGEGATVDSAVLPSDAVRALKLRIAHGDDGAPPRLLSERPELDPAWVALAEGDFVSTRYDQVVAPEFWLPGDFDFTFRCPWPDGHVVRTGSIGALVGQLSHLRENLLGGTPFDIALWRADEAPTREVAALARRAAALLEDLGRRALERHQPMLLSAAAAAAP